jgi:hypothetical protein
MALFRLAEKTACKDFMHQMNMLTGMTDSRRSDT